MAAAPTKPATRNKTQASPDIALIAKRALPVVSIVLAFVGMVILYRHVFPWIAEVPTAEPEVQETVAQEASSESTYAGVEDPWVDSGLFTMGNAELDSQIKAFCDALSIEGSTALQNAQFVYDTIVWSTFEERTADQKPAGKDWDVALMRHYFSTGNPDQGEGGSGDTYEFAAVTSYCLRYFGLSDAIAVPVLKTDDYGNDSSGALVLVTNTNGERCVCDPSLAVDGWMIGMAQYNNIVVEDIGQDLTAVEGMGLEIKQSEQPTQPVESQESQEQEQVDEEQADEEQVDDYGSYESEESSESSEYSEYSEY